MLMKCVAAVQGCFTNHMLRLLQILRLGRPGVFVMDIVNINRSVNVMYKRITDLSM